MKNIIIFAAILSLIFACSKKNLTQANYSLTDQQKSYWYDNDAEISSYKLKQSRYGEIREGHAVMVFVTEPFSMSSFTKADRDHKNNVPVLKLNFTKNFTTGIYPYSMMTSTFLPVDLRSESLKLSSSSQEWCGQTYVEMSNADKSKMDFTIHSYFEGENKKLTIDNSKLEDDVWSYIKLNHELLPTGPLLMVPSMFFLRLKHKETKAYKANAKLIKEGQTSTYVINYPDLSRELQIVFSNVFPYKIISWKESYPDGQNGEIMTTEGTFHKQLKIDYWTKNGLKDEYLRDDLGI